MRNSSAMLCLAQIHLLDPCILGNFLGRSFCQYATANQDRNSFSESKDQIHVVLDEQYGDLARKTRDNLEKLSTFRRRDTGGWLVKQKEARPRSQGQRDFQNALFSIGQILRGDVGIMGQAQGVQ